ncbi:4'-phosphopantetheinyl transferase family protein [Jutongia hominis]|uniref:4'-phosphopantetheinyl transferase superfamily protein n=1 Tax=Jutongia hominis TaxID=2763664 RepID=A0ABR7MRL4_9FIRM|nr:4'-phosphopantetheinyl transferase superfamily protein [Jutongia hominis]MBC8556439.1 4'-phosphopantetheinyl transferase superfamily protein [Jutongia hominis]
MYKTYLFQQEEFVKDDFVKQLLTLLPMERKEKALRYRNLIDRNNCVISYIMLKIALKECFGITKFTMKYDENGKPYLLEYPDIFFSISHCVYGCVVAVADELIGVDIQNVIPFSYNVAERVCCSEELNVLTNSRNQTIDFIRMWTIKESYLKMIGEGIVGDLKSVNTLEMSSSSTEIVFSKNIIIVVCRKK